MSHVEITINLILLLTSYFVSNFDLEHKPLACRKVDSKNELGRKHDGKDLKFFELVRFDFIIDQYLKVWLMEVNMSPNLNSGHFAQNAALYRYVR